MTLPENDTTAAPTITRATLLRDYLSAPALRAVRDYYEKTYGHHPESPNFRSAWELTVGDLGGFVATELPRKVLPEIRDAARAAGIDLQNAHLVDRQEERRNPPPPTVWRVTNIALKPRMAVVTIKASKFTLRIPFALDAARALHVGDNIRLECKPEPPGDTDHD